MIRYSVQFDPYVLRLDEADRATLLSIIPTFLLAVFAVVAPIPSNIAIGILALVGGLPIAADYLVRRDVFAPSGFLGLGYLISVFGPAMDLAAFGPDDRVLLLGEGPGYLIVPMLLVVIFVCILMTGLALSTNRFRKLPRIRDDWNHRRARIAGIGLSAVGSVAFLVFVFTSGGVPTSLTDLSAKRRPPTEYIRWGSQFLLYGAVILFADLVESPKERRRSSVILFVPSFLIAAFLPFYMSQRGILLTFIIGLFIIAYYRIDWITGTKLAVAFPLGIILSNTMLVLRKASWKGDSVLKLSEIVSLESVLGFFGATKGGLVAHTHLVHSVPGEMGYRFGSTLFQWVVFPVPRAIWPKKPINLGQQLGVAIYGQGVGVVGAGTPPLRVGELYINFDILGIIIGGLVFGLIVGWGGSYLRTSCKGPASVILYEIFMIEFVFGLIGVDFSHTMVGLVKWVVIFIPVLSFIIVDK